MSRPSASSARARSTTRSRPRPSPRRAAAVRRRELRRRRAAVIVVALLAGAGFAALLAPTFEDAVQQITLPLRHEDIIRQQARDKGLDPALIAAVIFAESHFRDQTSHAGAKGLMQITPQTADYIAKKSGGVLFETSDLSTPQVNISYGSYYLRYLMGRYDGDTTLTLAAYNAGEGNVDRWRANSGGDLEVAEIPFPETRHYVEKVQQARRDYRSGYAKELGL